MRNNITSNKTRFIVLLIIGLVFFSISEVYAQCSAGGNGQITICDLKDDVNAPNGKLSLVSLLEGSPSPGGIWTSDIENSGLNKDSGELNIFAIKKSGKHVYTYTVKCSDNNTTLTAEVILLLGPYLREGSDGSVCNDKGYNLFQSLKGEGNHDSHNNGTWIVDNEGKINGHIFDTESVELGIGETKQYSFTYTLPAVENCSSKTASFVLTVYRAPKLAKEPDPILYCETDDLSDKTNVNLFDFITGSDSDGKWTDESGTGQLVNSSFVNFQGIQKLGPGTYTFNYEVEGPSVCDPKSVKVVIKIKPQVDFNELSLKITPEVCVNDFDKTDFKATIIPKENSTKRVKDGTYSIKYTAGSEDIHEIKVDFKDGSAEFSIDKRGISLTSDKTTVTIKSITNEDTCDTNSGELKVSLPIHPMPDTMEDATLLIKSVCLGDSPTVEVTNSKLKKGNYIFTYNLTGKNQKTGEKTEGIAVDIDHFTFAIPTASVSNSGETTLTITNIEDADTGCSVKASAKAAASFTMYESVDLKNANISVTSTICQGDGLEVTLSGLDILTKIKLTYNVSGVNTIPDQTQELPVSNGISKFTIDKDKLPEKGKITLNISKVEVSGTTHCDTKFPENFPGAGRDIMIYEKPAVVKVPEGKKEYCSKEKKTLNDLNTEIIEINPGDYKFLWFDDVSSDVELSLNTLLVEKTYWVAKKNSGDCISEKTEISVVIHQVQVPTLVAEGQKFCGLDQQPTISDLSKKSVTDDAIRWFDAELNGNVLSESELLQDGQTYYGFGISKINECMSESPLIVTVSLANCDAEDHHFFIPHGFSPNGDGINDVFKIPKIDYIYPNYTLEIFNRYGNILYKGNKNSPPWDGRDTYSTSAGSGIVPNGVYFYILNYNKDNKPPKQSYLYLNR